MFREQEVQTSFSSIRYIPFNLSEVGNFPAWISTNQIQDMSQTQVFTVTHYLHSYCVYEHVCLSSCSVIPGWWVYMCPQEPLIVWVCPPQRPPTWLGAQKAGARLPGLAPRRGWRGACRDFSRLEKWRQSTGASFHLRRSHLTDRASLVSHAVPFIIIKTEAKNRIPHWKRYHAGHLRRPARLKTKAKRLSSVRDKPVSG